MKKLIISKDVPIEPLEGMQKVIIDLSLGRRKPKNDEERELLKQINDIKARGGSIELPLD